MRRVLLGAVLLLPALAAAKQKIVLDAPKPVSALIEKALKSKYTIKKASLANEPTGGDVKAACREAGGAVAVVTARLGGDLFTVMVLNGADGSPLSTFRVKAKNLKALPKPDVKKLLNGLDDAKAPKKEDAPKPPPEEAKPPPEEKRQEEKPEPVAEEKPRDRGRPKPSDPPPPPKEEVVETPEEPSRPGAATPRSMALRFGLGLKIFSRMFGYTDDIFDRLSTYTLKAGPAIAAELEVYPAAFVTTGFAANVGVLGQFDYAVGIASRGEDGTRYGTSAVNLRLALAVRLPVSVLTVEPFFGYALQTYSIAASSGAKPNLPNVSYGGLRGGLLLKVTVFGPVGLQLHLAGTYPLSKGEISTYFQHLSVGGMDTGIALTVGLLDRLEVKAAYEYRRYWFSMNSVPGDENVAGGALDLYPSGSVMIAFTF